MSDRGLSSEQDKTRRSEGGLSSEQNKTCKDMTCSEKITNREDHLNSTNISNAHHDDN